MATFNIDNGESVTGTAGNDNFFINEDLTLPAVLDGGDGIDRFDPQNDIAIEPDVTIRNMEVLALDNSFLLISAFNMATFDTIVADGADTNGILIFTEGDFFNNTTVTGLETLQVAGFQDDDRVTLQTEGPVVTDITFKAGGGNDEIRTGNGNDSLEGQSGDDFLRAGNGSDIINGGDGFDTASFNGEASAVSADLAQGKATGNSFVDTLTSIENLEGSTFADQLAGDSGSNEIQGGGGDDVLMGRGGFDTLDGNSGIDTATYAQETVAVQADLAAGKATLTGSSDTLVNIENLEGSNLADQLAGDELANRLLGNGGNDQMDGRAGNDTMLGGAGADTMVGGSGEDVMQGNDGDDFLRGGAGIDRLEGNAGKDRLNGEGGNDTLIGGAEADTYVFTANGGNDRVLGFQNNIDKLSFLGFGQAFNSVQELIAAADQVGANTVFTLPDPGPAANVTVTLTGFNVADLDAADFGPLIA